MKPGTKFGPPDDRTGDRNPFFGRKHSDEWRKAASKRQSRWTEQEVDMVRRWYAERRGGNLDLGMLSRALGRSKSTVSRFARSLGITVRNRHENPRTAGGRVLQYSMRLVRYGQRPEGWVHPRGSLGLVHSQQTRDTISKKARERAAIGLHPAGPRQITPERRLRMSKQMQDRIAKNPSSIYSSARRGRRADLGDVFFRSRWEANYARFLNLLRRQGVIRSWEFEPDTFWFDRIRRGVRSYKPDFKVTRTDGSVYYVEVKGWMDPKSKTKLKRMAKYHPTVELQVVDAKAYREIARKLGPAIPHWESERGLAA